MSKTKKKKLLVVVGAGASIELGMPSVKEVDDLFCKWSKKHYGLSHDKNSTLYSYIRDEVNHYYSLNSKSALRKETNFEEMLYVILQLSATLSDDLYQLPMNSFFGLKKLPNINSIQGEKTVDGNDLKNLSSMLIDNLIKEFRERCKSVKENKLPEFEVFEKFIKQLNDDYDVAFITLNYDNLLSQACPNLFTGFNQNSNSFDASSIYERENWGLVYHLHGSVHFDMQGEPLNMHAIKWNPDLNSTFKSNSSGRNTQNTSEGISMPTSVIVAGYGKTNQIQRVPFRTYYSKIDEMVNKADALLFMGYGFNDQHLNKSLHSIRDGEVKKSIVILDWADDNQEAMQWRHDEWSSNVCHTIYVNAHDMATHQYKNIAPDISDLKLKKEFEVSNNPDYPLSIWYGGFLEACKNYKKIRSELE